MATTARKTRKKTAPKLNVTVTFAQFDSNYQDNTIFDVVRDAVPIADFAPLGAEDYVPRGGTPLYDGVGMLIAHMDAVLKADKQGVHIALLADRSGSMWGNEESVIDGVNEFVGGMREVDEVDDEARGKVLFVILTDGDENSSVEFTSEKVKALVAKREEKGWEFIYLGANQDAWGVGFGNLGVRASTSYVSSPTGTSAAYGTLRNVGVGFVSENGALASRADALTSAPLGEHEVRSVASDADRGTGT